MNFIITLLIDAKRMNTIQLPSITLYMFYMALQILTTYLGHHCAEHSWEKKVSTIKALLFEKRSAQGISYLISIIVYH